MAFTSTIYWNITNSTLYFQTFASTAEISGSFNGTDVFDSASEVPWYQYRSTITKVHFTTGISPKYTAYWFYGCGNLTSTSNFSALDTSGTESMSNMFYGCSSLTSLYLASFDTSSVTDMYGMFYGCSSLASLDLSSFDTSNVDDMTRMFYNCTSLETIYVSDSWSTESVSYDTYMFRYCSSIVGGKGTTYNSSYTDSTYARIDTSSTRGYFTEGVSIYWGLTDGVLTLNNTAVSGTYSGIKYGNTTYQDNPWRNYRSMITSIRIRGTISPTSTAYWFTYLPNLTTITNLSNLDMSNVTNMEMMFSNTSSSSLSFDLTSWDVSNVTNMQYLFNGFAGTVDISTWDTSSVTDMSYMFSNTANIPPLKSLNTSNVTTMKYMFRNTTVAVLDLSNFNTSNVTNMYFMFYGASNLSRVCVGSGWSTTNVTESGYMFTGCTSIVGGNGTTYDADYTDKTYARIDTASTPGYLSEPRTEIYPFIGVDSVARKITDMYIGVNGVARKVLKGYIGVNGVAHQFFGDIYTPTNSYSVAKESSASYGFEQCSNTSDTYYFGSESSYDNTWCRSTNYNVGSSSTISVITLDIEQACTVTIDVVDYKNESSYDYGVLYALDDSTTTAYSGSSNHISGGTTVNYGTVAVGTHTIYVEYLKDSSVNNANDRLYFRVKFDGEAIAPTSVTT